MHPEHSGLPADGFSAILQVTLLLLLAAAVVIPIAQRLRINPVLGYLAIGLVLGPALLGVVPDVEDIQALADLGVVFMLFAIGLELSFARLRALKQAVLGFGLSQMVCTVLLLGAVALALGQSVPSAVVIALALAMSSTAMVLQLLRQRREMLSRHGRIGLGVLLMQDLAVVPTLALLPLLDGEATNMAGAMTLAMLKAAGAVVVLSLLGRLVLRPLLRLVARARQPESFTAIVLLIALGTGWLTHHAGLSMALGAFLAGILLAETEYRHQIEADIEPFRGLLLGLFFISVGMMIEPAIVWHAPLALLAVIVGLLAIKATVMAVVARVLGLPWGKALRSGLMLAQAGEFAFVVLAQAKTGTLVPPDLHPLLVAAIAITMALTPLLMRLGEMVENRLDSRGTPGDALPDLAAEGHLLDGHVVLVGFGRVGQSVAEMLRAAETPFLAFDMDANQVSREHRRGWPVFFGDCAQPGIMRAAQMEVAQAVLVTVDDRDAALHLVQTIRAEQPNVLLFARAHDQHDARTLLDAGANVAVPELLEGSLQLGASLLASRALPADAIAALVEACRAGQVGAIAVPPTL
jgi:monovalent cation:H+ antiporter-2, CPA2 family